MSVGMWVGLLLGMSVVGVVWAVVHNAKNHPGKITDILKRKEKQAEDLADSLRGNDKT